MDAATSLQVLSILSDALTTPLSLDEALTRIATMTCQLMETGQTVILMREDGRGELIVRTCVGIESEGLRPGFPLAVAERLRAILLRLQHIRQIGPLPTGIEAVGFPILVVPLRVKGERIGLLMTGRAQPPRDGFDAVQRRIFVMTASFASLLIENAKVYDYLRQQFAQRSPELVEASRRQAGTLDETQRLMVASLKDPHKVVRLLAVSFYKELARAGFSPDHITTAAAEILDCITRQEPVR